MRVVVTASRARELLKAMHTHSTGICNPGGINSLDKSFSFTYYYRGIRAIVKSVLDHCNGTCKLSKSLETLPPAPLANHTVQVMEEVQRDLIIITSKKRCRHRTDHDFKYILCVKDCFFKVLLAYSSRVKGSIANIVLPLVSYAFSSGRSSVGR